MLAFHWAVTDTASVHATDLAGDFEEDGLGHATDTGAPNVDFIVPADVTGVCTKADAPKF